MSKKPGEFTTHAFCGAGDQSVFFFHRLKKFIV